MGCNRPSTIRRSWQLCLAVSLAGAAATPPLAARAHATWSNGTAVPEWVRNACCGPWDIHHLDPSQVHPRRDGYAVDGVRELIPLAKVLPSMDGDYWVFFRNFDDGTQYVFCLFVPPSGV